MKCPHCNGNILRDQCVQCARYLPGFVYRKLSESKEKAGWKNRPRTYGLIGVCCCCGHTKRIWSDGLCSSCVSHVNGHYGKYYAKGTPEREAVLKRLAAAKAIKRERRTLKNYGMEAVI